MPRAAENPVEGVVHVGVFVRPKLGLGGGIHPGMHGPRQELGPEALERAIRLHHVLVEQGPEPGEGFRGSVGLELQHVQRQLVRPGDVSDFDLGGGLPGDRRDELVADGLHIEGFGVDDHELDLDAVRLEQARTLLLVQGHGGLASGLGHDGSPRRSSRDRNQAAISS